MKYHILVGVNKFEPNGYELILGSFDKQELKEEKEYNCDSFKKMKIITLVDSNDSLIIETLNKLNGIIETIADSTVVENALNDSTVKNDTTIQNEDYYTRVFRTSEGKNGKLNYSTIEQGRKINTALRSSESLFLKVKNKAYKTEITQDDRFTVYVFYIKQ